MHEPRQDCPSARLTAALVATLLMAMPTTLLAQAPDVPDAAPQPIVPVAPDAAREVDIDEYIVRGNTVLDARAIELAVTPFLGPKRTLKDIEAARDALLAAYQAKGYQSVYVDLPEQQVSQGVVLLQVNETRVGRLRVVGSEFTSPLQVREQVPALKEGEIPDFNQAQVELTTLNRTAKRQVTPVVRQGSVPGTMDVDLKVADSSPWRASVGLNNDYSADTHVLRATASLGHDNLWQWGHALSLSFFGAPQELNETKVFSGSYEAPIPATNWSLELAGYKSDSNVATVGGTSVLGRGYAIGLKATYTAPGAGAWFHAFSAGVDFKSNDEDVRLGASGDSVNLRYAPFTFAYSGFFQAERSQVGLGLTLVAGTRSSFGYGSDSQQFDNKRFGASPSFLILKSDFSGTYGFEDQSQLGLRLSGQLTDDPLVSSEQIAGGGANSVRGYLSAEATADYGLVGSAEWRSRPLPFAASWIGNWRIHGFLDAAHLRLKDALPEQRDNFSLSSIGLGTSFRVGTQAAARFDLGYPLRDGPRTSRHEARGNFSLTASY